MLHTKVASKIMSALSSENKSAHSLLKQINQDLRLNEYEKHFLWVVEQILESLYCMSYSDTPFTMIKESFMNDDIVSDLSRFKQLQLDIEFTAKINDCFWIFKHDYESACVAYKLYDEIINSSSNFELVQHYPCRLISIATLTNNALFKENIAETIEKIMTLSHNIEDFRPFYIIRDCFQTKLLSTDRLILYCNDKTKNLSNYRLTEAYLLLQEKIVFEKIGKKYSDAVSNNEEINAIRRSIVNLFLNSAETASNIYIKIDLLTKAIATLKKLKNTEDERNVIRKQLDGLQIDRLSQMKSIPIEFDITDPVKYKIECLSSLEFDEYLYYLITSSYLSKKKEIEEKTIQQHEQFIFRSLFPETFLDRRGKMKVSVPTLDLQSIDSTALLANMQVVAREDYELQAQIYLQYIFNEMHRRKFDVTPYVEELVQNSYFVPTSRKKAFITGLLAGYNYDFISAVSILIPQVENAIRCLAEKCGDVVYNIDDDGLEEAKTMDAVMKLPCLNDCIDETIMFHIQTVFTSKFGYNIRNEVAHGLFEDSEFSSLQMFFVWWFILKICFEFSRIDLSIMQNIKNKIEPITIKYKEKLRQPEPIDNNLKL